MFFAGRLAYGAIIRFIAAVFMFAWPAVFSGCATSLQPSQPAPVADTPVYETAMDAPPPAPDDAADGALWRGDAQMASLFVTPKARNVGNILTVKIVESSSAKNSATTSTGRNSEIVAGIDKFFNLEKYINPYTQVAGAFDSQFEGDGSTDRSGKLMATITVRVVEVLPGGNLRIAGSRDVAVNGERQFITLTGFVRPDDIDYKNTVLSTYISDARIAYSGSGIVNDVQRPGWLMRTLDIIWPF